MWALGSCGSSSERQLSWVGFLRYLLCLFSRLPRFRSKPVAFALTRRSSRERPVPASSAYLLPSVRDSRYLRPRLRLAVSPPPPVFVPVASKLSPSVCSSFSFLPVLAPPVTCDCMRRFRYCASCFAECPQFPLTCCQLHRPGIRSCPILLLAASLPSRCCLSSIRCPSLLFLALQVCVQSVDRRWPVGPVWCRC